MTLPTAAPPADPAPEHRWRVQDLTLVGGAFIALNLVVPSVVGAIDVGGASATAARALIATLLVQLAVIGVIAVLVATDTAVSIVVLIGAILLAGIVVNNAIILVDATNRIAASGSPVRP